MNILIVHSHNSVKTSVEYTFVNEQADALKGLGHLITFFGINGKGALGYLRNYKALKCKIKEIKPNIIHAHYGLSGLLANLQRQIPVITTYHGSDINNRKVAFLSKLSIILSAHNIFVSEKIMRKCGFKYKNSLIPCGIDLSFFKPMDKKQSRSILGFDNQKKLVLFAGSFGRAVKNHTLAKEAVAFLPNVQLLELKGYSREQVVLLMNAVDVVLMTSISEGSPQFIKEAMACNCPIVSVPVGDVPELIDNLEGCYISSYKPNDIAEKLQKAMDFGNSTSGRDRILAVGLDNEMVAKRLSKLYASLLKMEIIE